MRSGVLAAGNWIRDHVKVVDGWPAQEGLANIVGQHDGNGGGPYNVLKDLARLGAPFPLEAAGIVGDDPDGRAILAECAALGIDAAQLRTDAAAPTSYTDVMTVSGTGRRTFFHNRGANALLSPEHVDFGRTTARYFYLGYLLLLDRLDEPGPDGIPRACEVLRRARAAGIETVLDCVSAASERFRTSVAPVLAEVDTLFVNDYEAEQLTGMSLGRGESLDRGAVESAARDLIARGVRTRAVLHFPEGACACDRGGAVTWQAAVSVPRGRIASTVGAGDALAAGVLYGLHAGWALGGALELGVCAAAASLTHPTCSEGVLAAADCLGLGRSLGFRRT